MNLLMLILSVVMTWTVESKNSVSGEGTYPATMTATYSCSYQKGTVRAKDTATISFANMGGMTIEQIEVYVRSNKSAGSGIITVDLNGSSVATKEGSLKDWVGLYDNSNYHSLPLLQTSISDVHELSVSLVGTVNSLYIEKYVIQYTPASVKSVTLMKGNAEYTTLTEKSAGAGVILPDMADEGNWKFAAWSRNHFYQISTMPDSWILPGRFYPVEKDTLWAVYAYDMPYKEAFATTLSDGLYLYADTTRMIAMSGAVSDGITENAAVNISDPSQVYDITFDETSETAIIYHPATNTYIGYNGLSLADEASLWKVYHSGATTAFYMQSGNKTYILWPDYIKQIYVNEINEFIPCAALVKADNLSSAPTVLISAEPLMEEPVFTCHPENGMGIENAISPQQKEYNLPIGNYRLIIRNGQKFMQIQ